MACTQRFSKREEVYDLGMLTRACWPDDTPRKRGMYVFYKCQSPVERQDGLWASEETVSFHREELDDPLLGPGLQPRYQNHPFLTDLDAFLPIVKRTATDGSVRRYMVRPPALSDDGCFHDVPYDLSTWDARIKARLAELPPHVRDVFGI